MKFFLIPFILLTISQVSFGLKGPMVPDFYSKSSEERTVTFSGLVQTDYKSKEIIQQLSQNK